MQVQSVADLHEALPDLPYLPHLHTPLLATGKVFISMADKYKQDAIDVARTLTELGYSIVATRGTAVTLGKAGARQQPGRAECIECYQEEAWGLDGNKSQVDHQQRPCSMQCGAWFGPVA